MNLIWSYSFEPSLPREVMRVDADGVLHLEDALLTEIRDLLRALDRADEAAYAFALSLAARAD